jgi:predicted nucleotidyltransferase
MDRAELEGTLSEIVDRLRKALSPVAIYLHGSCAYGAPGPASDIDLVVLVGDSRLDPYERDAVAYRALIGIGVAKDVQVYTRAEFEERAALPVSFERTVKQKGKLLYAA